MVTLFQTPRLVAATAGWSFPTTWPDLPSVRMDPLPARTSRSSVRIDPLLVRTSRSSARIDPLLVRTQDFGGGEKDARLAWAAAYQTIPRSAYIGLREAWDDRRVIEAYRKKFAGDQAALDVLEKILAEARKSQSSKQGGKDLVYDFWEVIDDVSKLDVWRNALLNKLSHD